MWVQDPDRYIPDSYNVGKVGEPVTSYSDTYKHDIQLPTLMPFVIHNAQNIIIKGIIEALL